MNQVSSTSQKPQGQYKQLLNVPGAKPLMSSILAIKFSHAIVLLGLLLTINDARGTALGGIAVAVYVLAGSIVSPFKAFLLERFGMSKVLLTLAISTAMSHVLLAMTLETNTPQLLGLVALCGASWPHCSAMPIWQIILSKHLLPTAAAADSILTSIAYTTGSLAASFLAVIDFRLAIAFPALLALIGVTALVSLSVTGQASVHHQSAKGVIPQIGWLLALMTFGVYLALDSFIVLSATSSGPGYAGIMSAMLIGSSAVSSFRTGRLAEPITNQRLLICAGLLIICGLLVGTWSYTQAPLFTLAFVLALFGWSRSPLLIAANTKIVAACPVAPYRAFALQSISITMGAAAGNAAGGVLGSWAGLSIIIGASIAFIACYLIYRYEQHSDAAVA